MMLCEQHPYFVHRRSRASGYRRPCSSRVWSASRVGTFPSFFRAGRHLYRSWTVHQCWCFTSTVGSFSFLILAFVWHAYPALVLFSEESKVRSFRFRFSLLLYSSLGHLLWNSFENRKRTFSGRKINHQSYGPETGDFFGSIFQFSFSGRPPTGSEAPFSINVRDRSWCLDLGFLTSWEATRVEICRKQH